MKMITNSFLLLIVFLLSKVKGFAYDIEKSFRTLSFNNLQIHSNEDDPSCPCIKENESFTTFDTSSNFYDKDIATLDTYGVGCSAHDENTEECTKPNICNLQDQTNCDRSWCARSWCYVDGNNCKLQKSESYFYEKRYFSYATCGYIDSLRNQYQTGPLIGKTFNVAFLSNTGGWKGAYNTEGSFAINNFWRGPLVKFINEARALGQFNLNITKPLDKLVNSSMSYFKSTSSFDLCVYAVALGYLDFCVAGFTINNKRTSTTPFFQAYTDYIYVILFNNDESNNNWDTFTSSVGMMFQPFAAGTWCLIILLLCGLGFLMYLLETGADLKSHSIKMPRPVRVFNYETNLFDVKVKNAPLPCQIGNSVYRSSLAFFHQTYEQIVITPEGRINLIVISSFILILIEIYTANLTAILTTDLQNQKISTLDEAVHRGYTFCAERNLGIHLSELYNFDMNLLVPDPVSLGGDGLPGFACPHCSSRTLVFDRMRRSHSDPSQYCNAAFVYGQDLELHHQRGDHCDKEKVIVLGKVEVGIPLSSAVFGGISSLFHELKYRGILEKAVLNDTPQSQCPIIERNETSLSVLQLSGVWIFCFFFSFVAIMLRLFQRGEKQEHHQFFYCYDQWGNSYAHENVNHLTFHQGKNISNGSFVKRIDGFADLYDHKGRRNSSIFNVS